MERIGRYRTDRVLGSGAFGTVWLAHDETLDAPVAIKVLAENWARDDAFRRRFIDEAKILFRADSDHLIRVHTVDELPDGRPYFVMDYADRGSLEERMRAKAEAGGWFRVEEALAISRDIAQGLRVVHALGLAHRDLKPANVMYRSGPAHADDPSQERLVLVDFGIARSLDHGAATTIATGTPHYMAPEQADGRADRRSDVYSAAVILYEVLARQVPYPFESIGQIIRAQAAGEFAPLRSIRGDVSPELDAVIARGLASDPDERYGDADAWLAALDDPASAPPSPATPVAAVAAGATMSPEELRAARAAGAGTTPPRAPPPAPPTGSGGAATPPPKKRRSRLLLTSLALIAVLAGAIGVVALTAANDEPDGPVATEVFAEPISSLGTDPFADATPPPEEVAATDGRLAGLLAALGGLPTLTLPPLGLSTVPPREPDAVTQVAGSTPGLFGGTNLLSVCDKEQLVAFLEENADKARAWAETLGIEVDEIDTYVAGLTDVILRSDTRVTNHGFKDGVIKPLNSILQAGTAVLIDKFGVPQVRCKCGNPLKPARPLSVDVAVRGQIWPNLDLGATVTITRGDEVTEFTLGDVVTGEPIYRVPGSDATTATNTPSVSVPPETAPPETAPPDSAPPVTEPTTGPDITATGTISNFSSEFPGGEFPVGLAIDGDVTTSWFSAGPDGGDTEESFLDFSLPAATNISKLEIVGNAANANPDNREGFGFAGVSIQIFEGGTSVFSAFEELPGTPDPDVSVTPNVSGDRVRVAFGGHEARDCGGIAELRVYG
ncbi:MAG: DUF6777 domain-containing protein [Actinomycetota bacterium]